MLPLLQSESFIRDFQVVTNRKSVNSPKREKNWVIFWEISHIVINIVLIRDPKLEFQSSIGLRTSDHLDPRCLLIPWLNNPWTLRTCYRIDHFDWYHLFSSNPNRRNLFRVIQGQKIMTQLLGILAKDSIIFKTKNVRQTFIRIIMCF